MARGEDEPVTDDHTHPHYRFPKSRSKRLSEAVEMARELAGFEERESEYRVSPTLEQISEASFVGLFEISHKWKGAGFYLGDSSIPKSEFLQALESGASREMVPEPPRIELERSREVAPEEPVDEVTSPVGAESEKKQETEADNKVKMKFVEESPGAPLASEPEATKKRRSCCCCCWWLPFGATAVLGLLAAIL